MGHERIVQINSYLRITVYAEARQVLRMDLSKYY